MYSSVKTASNCMQQELYNSGLTKEGFYLLHVGDECRLIQYLPMLVGTWALVVFLLLLLRLQNGC